MEKIFESFSEFLENNITEGFYTTDQLYSTSELIKDFNLKEKTIKTYFGTTVKGERGMVGKLKDKKQCQEIFKFLENFDDTWFQKYGYNQVFTKWKQELFFDFWNKVEKLFKNVEVYMYIISISNNKVDRNSVCFVFDLGMDQGKIQVTDNPSYKFDDINTKGHEIHMLEWKHRNPVSYFDVDKAIENLKYYSDTFGSNNKLDF